MIVTWLSDLNVALAQYKKSTQPSAIKNPGGEGGGVSPNPTLSLLQHPSF